MHPTSSVNWSVSWRDLRHFCQQRNGIRKLGGFSLAALRGQIVRVPMTLCTNRYAYSFGGPNGWHYYRDLVEEILRHPDIALEDTRFHRFFTKIQAPSLTAMLSFHDPELRRSLPELPYGSYPWGPYEWYTVKLDPHRFYDRSCLVRRTPTNSRTSMISPIGPAFSEYIFYEKTAAVAEMVRHEFKDLTGLASSFRESGYRPLLGQALIPTAGRLVAESGEARYLLKDGNHRLATLAAFGCEHVWLRLDRGRIPEVFEAEAGRWPWVRSGLISERQARRVFRLFFRLNGTERANALDLFGAG